MSEIIFVKTHYHYDSYNDFWKLVQLSGFPIIYAEDMNPWKDAIYIVSPYNGEWIPTVDSIKGKNRAAKFMLWNLERPSGSGGLGSYISDNTELIRAGYFDRILVSDYELANVTNFHFVPMGSHKDLGAISELHKIYDFALMGCYSGNRAWLFRTPEKVHERLRKMMIAPNMTASEERHIILQRTKIMLALHQDTLPFVEPIRYALAAAYAMPILAEKIYVRTPYEYGIYVIDKPLPIDRELILDHMETMLGSYDWKTQGLKFHESMTTTYSFRRCLEGSL